MSKDHKIHKLYNLKQEYKTRVYNTNKQGIVKILKNKNIRYLNESDPWPSG